MESFISERYRVLLTHFPGTIQTGTLRDPHGVYAFVIQSPTGRQYYFAAKNSMKGGIISIHKTLLTDAIRFSKDIIMGIKEDFYRFSPRAIKEGKAFENVFHGAQMVNFYVTLGHDVLEADKRSKGPPEQNLFDPIPPALEELAGAITEKFGGERIYGKP